MELRVWSLDDTHLLSMYYTQVLPPCTIFFQWVCMNLNRGVELSLEEASAEIERYPSHLWKDDTHVLPGAEKKKCALCMKYERGRYMYNTFYDAI